MIQLFEALAKAIIWTAIGGIVLYMIALLETCGGTC